MSRLTYGSEDGRSACCGCPPGCVLGVKVWEPMFRGFCRFGSIMISRLYKSSQRFSKQVNDQHLSAYASSTAFFTFLSLIPMIMVLLSALPYLPFTQEEVFSVFADIFPTSMYDLIEGILSDLYDTSGVMLPITLLLTIWSAAKGMLALLRGLNVIFGVEEFRNYFILRLRAAIYTFGMLVIVLLLLVGVVFMRSIAALVTGTYPHVRPIFEFIESARFLIIIMVMTLLFTALYTYLPNVKNRFHWELPGALFASCAWYFASWVFSVYVNQIMGTNTYGSLTTVLIAMIWMYMIFYMVLLGAALNVFLHGFFHRKKCEYVDKKKKNQKKRTAQKE